MHAMMLDSVNQWDDLFFTPLLKWDSLLLFVTHITLAWTHATRPANGDKCGTVKEVSTIFLVFIAKIFSDSKANVRGIYLCFGTTSMLNLQTNFSYKGFCHSSLILLKNGPSINSLSHYKMQIGKSNFGILTLSAYASWCWKSYVNSLQIVFSFVLFRLVSCQKKSWINVAVE